jgi:hypothetical protein
MIAGGQLAEPAYLLEKYQDDGGLSLWAGRPSDGSRDEQIAAAARALPLPNGKVRAALVSALEARGWSLVHSPSPGAADPDRHYDAVYSGGTADLDTIKGFIDAFDEPIPNRWRQR